MTIRKYSSRANKKGVERIWHECGWIEDNKKDKEALEIFIKGSRSLLMEINGEAEAFASAVPGDILFGKEKLRFSAVTAVTTSRIARKQGCAAKVLGALLAEEAECGTAVAGLGIFDQGYYEKHGFGTINYENLFSFDPGRLITGRKPRIPQRIESKDWKSVYNAQISRRRSHGSINIDSPSLTRAEMLWTKNGFGLGYKEGNKITHCIWISPKDIEDGPYVINLAVYQTMEQLMELLGLISGLSDQVKSVRLREPAGIHLQDFIRRPFHHQAVSGKGSFESRTRAIAYHQARICDMDACISALHIPGKEVRFNLSIEDPVKAFLPKGSSWKGCGGDYCITIGGNSELLRGHRKELPLLTADIGAFTRFWLGVLPASGLAVSGKFTAPESLIKELDTVIRFSPPSFDWDI